MRTSLVAAAALALPRAAEACAVCTGGNSDSTQRAFLVGSILLSVLPLALVAGISVWLRRRIRMQQERPAAPAAPALSASLER